MPIAISNLTATGTTGNLTVNFDATVTNDTTTPGLTNFITSVALGTLRSDYTGQVGMKITVAGAAVSVKTLGRYVFTGNSQSHVISLMDSTGAVLGTVTVATSGATSGQFVYATLSAPIALSANTVYYVMSNETNGGDVWDTVTDASGLTVTTTAVAVLNSGAFQNIAGSPTVSSPALANHPYVPLDFQY